jgi:hypothetical protein
LIYLLDPQRGVVGCHDLRSNEMDQCRLLVTRLTYEIALTIAGYNAVSRFLIALDVAEMMNVKVGDAKLPGAKL